MENTISVEHEQTEIDRLTAERDSLLRYVAVLSAIVDLQELPKAVDADDYRRLIRSLGIRKHRKRITP